MKNYLQWNNTCILKGTLTCCTHCCHCVMRHKLNCMHEIIQIQIIKLLNYTHFINVCVHTETPTHGHTQTHIHTYIHTVHTYVHTQRHTVHTHTTHTHTYAHTHKYTTSHTHKTCIHYTITTNIQLSQPVINM